MRRLRTVQLIAMVVVVIICMPALAKSDDCRRISNGPHGDNCVLYARTLIPLLPHGLDTMQAKRKIINNGSPKRDVLQ